MRLVRSLLVGIIALVALVAIGLAVLLTPAVQTWLVHRQLAARPDLHLSIGRVAASLDRVELTEVIWTRGTTRLQAPTVTANLPVLAAVLHARLDLSRLVAHGWTLEFANPNDLVPGRSTSVSGGAAAADPATALWRGQSDASRATAAPPAVVRAGNAISTPIRAAPAAVTHGFDGVFTWLQLPFDASVAAVDLQGRIVLPAGGGAAAVRISGGGLSAGRTARFTIDSDDEFGSGPVKATRVSAVVTATMDTPRTFTDLRVQLKATATGPAISRPFGFQTELAARRSGGAENYDAAIARGARQLVVLHAELPAHHNQLKGVWALDIRDPDVAAIAEGRQLPAFTAVGQGQWQADPTFANVHAAGGLDAHIDHLGAISADLAGIGPMNVNADVDLARHDSVLTVTKFDAAVAGAEPVATVHALQAFQFNPGTGELRPTDANRELVGIVLQGMPLAWVKPFAREFAFQGGGIRGELVATPRAGGFSFRAKSPLTVDRLEVSRGGQPLIRGVSVSVTASGDYAPQGWQAELNGVAGVTGSAKMLLLDAKAGQLAGADQPIKATGLLGVDLGALAAQPVAHAIAAVKQGSLSAEFAASLGRTTELEAKFSARDLAAMAGTTVQPVPAVSGTVRADVATDGHVRLNAPITLERDGRKSDLAISGSLTRSAAGDVFDGQVSSANLVIEDAQSLALLAPAKATQPATGKPAVAPWSGLNGTLAVQLKHVVYTGKFEMTNVTGKVRVSGGTLILQGMRGTLGGGGDAQVTGAVNFDAAAERRFTLAADVALTDFDPAPLIMAANPGQPPTIEGRFTITTKVTGEAATLHGLPGAVAGDFALTSKGGVFRGMPVNVGNLVENSGKLASWLASAGNAITSLAGRKDYDEITSRSEAANELAKILSAIPYDQLGMVVSRDDVQNIEVKELTLISPELRITGSGRAHRVPGHSFLNDVVDLNLRLRARGRPAELMKYLGILDPKPDDLGYAACTIPVKVEGSLVKLDTTQLSNRLVALAVEKTGLTEKAVDWINRLRGKSPN